MNTLIMVSLIGANWITARAYFLLLDRYRRLEREVENERISNSIIKEYEDSKK